MDFRPKEGLRNILELLQYLTIVGSAMPKYWLKKDDSDFNAFFGAIDKVAKAMPYERFLPAMDEQMAAIRNLLDQLSEDDLINKEVVYPWGGTAPWAKPSLLPVLSF